MTKTQTLYRPVSKAELDLIQASAWKAFPPRLAEQDIFYPVLNQEYASHITKKWNVKSYGNGFVTSFEVPTEYIKKYKVQNVGEETHNELWIPSKDLEEFNAQIQGEIKVIGAYEHDKTCGYLFLEDILDVPQFGKVLITSRVNDGYKPVITQSSSLNGVPLAMWRNFGDKSGFISLKLRDDTQIEKFTKRTLVLFRRNSDGKVAKLTSL